MSFRFELKSFGSNVACNNFIEKLLKSGMKQLYPPRYITSEYFDTANLECVTQSQEGTVPRKKFRIRYYPKNPNLLEPNKNTPLSLEIKISSPEGRYKTIKKISYSDYINFKDRGMFIKSYGRVTFALRVNYLRHYYSVDGIRLTFDSKITRSKLRENSGGFKLNNQISKYSVVELKSNISDSNLINNTLAGLRLQRFSKYADSFVKL